MFFERSSIVTLIGVFGVLLAVALFTYVSYMKRGEADAPATSTIRDHESTMFTDLGGNSFDITKFAHSVVVINSWATWSPFSKDELMVLADIKRTVGADVEIIAINRMEPEARARAYIESLGVADVIHVLFDSSDQYFNSVGGYAMPETLIYGPDGVLHTHIRGTVARETLIAHIEALRSKIK